MEARLKKQRGRLFLRVILILLAVWLIVSAVFCAVRLSIEKANVRGNGLSEFSRFKQLISVGYGSSNAFLAAFEEDTDIVYDEDEPEKKSDSQLVFIDRKTNKVLADTAGGIVVKYHFKWSGDETANFVTLLDYDSIRGKLSDDEFREIEEKLNTVRDDGNYYELVCTKLYYSIIQTPLEMKLVLIDGSDPRRILDDDVASFSLDENYIEGEEILESGVIGRNTVPKSFILDRRTNDDLMSSLTKEQLKSNVEMIPLSATEYIFYSSDILSIQSEDLLDGEISWTVRYAKRIDLFENCKTDLYLGAAVIFSFFLTIALILCVTIWRTVKVQIIQEQKRSDLTNALAHDIKTPLFVISGYAYSLREDIDADKRDSYLNKIIEQTDEINSLVHRMLSLSKLDSYTMTLNRAELDLFQLTKDIIGNYPDLPDGKSFTVTHRGDSTINADRELIKTAVQNLTDNALRYSPPGSEIRAELDGGTLRIVNPSEPLTKAELRQITQPYFRKDKSRHKNGNGLGLSIVKSIMDLHSAKLDIRQENGDFIASLIF